MTFVSKITQILSKHNEVYTDMSREDMIRHSVENREVFISKNGALASWTPCESTGRSPKDTYIVKTEAIEKEIDWDSPNNIPLAADTFDMVLEDALKVIEGKEKVYVTNRVIGADSRYALPVKTITDKAASALFSDNMFRPVPEDIKESVFVDREFTFVALPYEKLDKKRSLPSMWNDGSALCMVPPI